VRREGPLRVAPDSHANPIIHADLQSEGARWAKTQQTDPPERWAYVVRLAAVRVGLAATISWIAVLGWLVVGSQDCYSDVAAGRSSQASRINDGVQATIVPSKNA